MEEKVTAKIEAIEKKYKAKEGQLTGKYEKYEKDTIRLLQGIKREVDEMVKTKILRLGYHDTFKRYLRELDELQEKWNLIKEFIEDEP